MKLIDSHTHLNFRTREEFSQLVAHGYESAVTCAFYPIVPRGPDTLLDLFDLILERYCGEQGGLTIFAALGIHPRSIPRRDCGHVIDGLPLYLEKQNVVAMGEIGLEAGDGIERTVLARQLDIAKKAGAKVIMHTPKENKEALLGQELEIIQSSGIDPEQVIIDHNNEKTIKTVLEGGFFAGVTVSRGKMSAKQAVDAITKHEKHSGRIILNTDLGYSSNYLFDLPDAAKEIADKLGPQLSKEVTYGNAKRFFGI